MPARLFPSHISWRIDEASLKDPSALMSGDHIRRVEKTAAVLGGAGYEWRVEVVDDAFLNQFVPLYEEHMRGTYHGTVFDVRGKIGASQQKGKPYYSISLWYGSQFLGGLLYSVTNTALGVAYRFFPHRLPIKTPISCGYVAEGRLLDEARALGKTLIRHGKDRNEYGPHASIGLAEYKLRIGCVPYVSEAAGVTFFSFDEYTKGEEALVFVGERPGERIGEAYLFTQQSPEAVRQRYGSLFKQTCVRVTVQLYDYGARELVIN